MSDKKIKNKKEGEKKNRSSELMKKMPVGPGNFWNNMLSTILVLMLVVAGYSYIAERQEEPVEASLSAIAEGVKAGEVSEIIVRGSKLEISYRDDSKAKAEGKKEVDASITETLANLGVTSEQIAGVTIDVQKETGFSYYLSTFAPFIFPLVFLLLII